MGARVVFAHARSARKLRRALPPVETGRERVTTSLEERALGGAHKMAAPLVSDWSDDQVLEESQSGTAGKMAAPVGIEDDEVVIISDEEEGELRGPEGAGDQVLDVFIGAGMKGVDRRSQSISKLFSPRSGKVQSGHLDKRAVFRLGEQVEFVDDSGRVLSGRVLGETSGSSAGDRAIVQLDVSQAIWSEGPSGCDMLPASGGQGVKAVYRPSGRMVGDRSTPVKVRAPSAHRPEGRARSGAVRLTSKDAFRVCDAQPSTSQGAGDGWDEWCDDLLDYDEDLDFQVPSKQSEQFQKETPGAVQGGQVPEQSHVLSTSGFPRGEEGLGVFGVTQGGSFGRGVSGGSRASYLQGEKDISHKVDAAIQANVVMEVGSDTLYYRQEDAVNFVMQQIERGLAAVIISGKDPLLTLVDQTSLYRAVCCLEGDIILIKNGSCLSMDVLNTYSKPLVSAKAEEEGRTATTPECPKNCLRKISKPWS
ncbi:hypothetical protein NDU88_001185 [Pleurodeles waltl]|uniref:Uncharacterized protein n=1 Tax=Pleurodeles waltl TaxID=8319 RepID=A0AAV7TGW4_PLEWA|nr:hypothetical protein NDU88_001185 [Pleurodeles waltl]